MVEQLDTRHRELSVFQRHDLLSRALRRSFLAGLPAEQALESPKQPAPQYDQVVFGHDLADFDRDQAIAYYFARKGNLIAPESPVVFTPTPDSDQLTNPQALVLEGFSPEQHQTPTGTKTGNFANSPQDDIPAATVFFEAHQRAFQQDKPLSERLRMLSNWLKATESNLNDEKKAELFSTINQPTRQKLEQVTPLLYGLKAALNRPGDSTTLLENVVVLLDQALDPTISPEQFAENFKVEEQLAEKQRNNREMQLKERAKSPEHARLTTTAQGLTLGYFDVRGIRGDGGAFTAFREQHSKADVVMLVDTAVNSETGRAHTKIIIKGFASEKNSDLDVLKQLGERFPLQEDLYGHGQTLILTDSYGGHSGEGGILGTPAGSGTGLKPTEVWLALQTFFERPRFTREEFAIQCQQLSDQIGVTHFTTELPQLPASPIYFREHQVVFDIPDVTNTIHRVIIPESDLPYYLSEMGSDQLTNRQLLIDKTALTEPDAIADKRAPAQHEQLKQAITKRDALRILLLLDDNNLSVIQSLSTTEQLQLLQAIAASPQAIELIWDKDNLTFKITQPSLPNWVTADLEKYKTERYQFLSVPSKIDRHLVKTLVKNITNENSSPFITALLTILENPAYRAAHRTPAPDSLLESTLEAISNLPDSHPDRADWINRIVTAYPPESLIWQQISPRSKRSINAVLPEFFAPEELVDKPFFTEDKPHIEATQTAATHVHAILVQIGRDIREKVLTSPVFRPTDGQQGVHLSSEIHVAGTFDAGAHSEETRQLLTTVLEHTSTIARTTEGPVRIIAGGWPGNFIMSFTVALFQTRAAQELLSRIEIVNFDTQQQAFTVRKLLSDFSFSWDGSEAQT